MAERWQQELRKVGAIEPSTGLWERARAGPVRPDPPDGREPSRGRALAIVVSLAVVLAGGIVAWRAFAPDRHAASPGLGQSPPPGHTPDFPSPIGHIRVYLNHPAGGVWAQNRGGHLVVHVRFTTNMPESTVAFVRYTYVGGIEHGAGGLSVSTEVRDGRLTVNVPWNVCAFGRGFKITVEFRPFYEDYRVPGYPPNSPWPPTQAESILSLLGHRFQAIDGAQVTIVPSSQGPIRQLSTSVAYAWPDLPANYPPPPCPSPVPKHTPPGP